MKKLIAILIASTLPAGAIAQEVEGNSESTAKAEQTVNAIAATGGTGRLFQFLLGGTTSTMTGAGNNNAPCAMSSSSAWTVGPVGRSRVKGTESIYCLLERRAGFFIQAGQPDKALAVLCEDMLFADAVFVDEGLPCIGQQDNPRYWINGERPTNVFRLSSAAIAK